MSNLLQKFAQKQINELEYAKSIPQFKAGDTLEVHVRISEGSNERIQIFKGVCLRRRSSGNGITGATFTVKKVSNGEMVERIFMLYSPKIAKIVVSKVGRVRRAKLYYLRYLMGKAARIKELNKFEKNKNAAKAKDVAEKKLSSSAEKTEEVKVSSATTAPVDTNSKAAEVEAPAKASQKPDAAPVAEKKTEKKEQVAAKSSEKNNETTAAKAEKAEQPAENKQDKPAAKASSSELKGSKVAEEGKSSESKK